MGHFQRGIQEPLLLHVDGGGGTGKSYLIKVLSSHLQQSVPPGTSSPIWRAAPTGVASNQISGTTLHSLLRLPIDTAWADLSPTHLGNIQKTLRGVQYLVIDEKSMLGLRTLGWIDHRLRQVFPRRNAEFFGGMSLILVGDFFQLPPVMQKPLYYDQGSDPFHAHWRVVHELTSIPRQSIPHRRHYVSRQFHAACLWIELNEIVDDG